MSRTRPLLSAVMIVRDEEKRLPACLESARPYFDEIIIVDTGSTDRTREIAVEYGARVVDFPWTDSFAEARNTLERQWSRGEDVSTEDLRIALRKYRSFFERLLVV